MPYWGISLSCWGALIGVVMHGRMVFINYLLHVRIICYTGAYFSLWWDGWLCTLYLWFSILHGELMSQWSVFAFVASLSAYMSTFFSFMICDTVICYIQHCLRLRWTHQISPRKYRWTPLSWVYEIICFCHSCSFVKLWCAFVELYLWDQLTRNLFEIWRNLCLYFSRPLSWGVASFSLRYLQLLVSLDILAAWCNHDIGAYPLCRSYPIFFAIFIGVQSHHFHRHSEPSFS